jgi:hypothetical protein
MKMNENEVSQSGELLFTFFTKKRGWAFEWTPWSEDGERGGEVLNLLDHFFSFENFENVSCY